MSEEQVVRKKDFIELKYSGYANGELFDSNIEEDLKKLNPKTKTAKTIIAVGEGMVVAGLDKTLEGKEIGKEYEVDIDVKDGFGERKRELVKTIPLSAFRENDFNPRPGMVLTLDNYLVKIIAVSGARVVTDFNNPLAGKKLHYKFIIVRKVADDNEKATALFEVFFKFVPKFSIENNAIVVSGDRNLEIFVKIYNEKFKELLGKGLELKEEKSDLEAKVAGDNDKKDESEMGEEEGFDEGRREEEAEKRGDEGEMSEEENRGGEEDFGGKESEMGGEGEIVEVKEEIA